MFILAIILTAVGAAGLAVGTHLQHRAMNAGTTGSRPGATARVAQALRRPCWLLGMAIVIIATTLNVVALGLAPVAVVQPVGALSLVFAAIISATVLRLRVRRGLLIGIAVSTCSVALFVAVSAGFARQADPTWQSSRALALLLAVLIVVGAIVAVRRTGHFARVVSAGILFGAVAASVHVVAGELLSALHAETTGTKPGFWMLVTLTLVATAVGAWLVQTAYASGPPETVLAGLTVIDPLVAVLVGALLLGEYSAVSPLGAAGLALSAVSAAVGIVMIAHHQPTRVSETSPQRPSPPRTTQREAAEADHALSTNGRS